MPLTLLDYSDRELLHIVHEVAEEHGGSAPSMEIALALGLNEKEKAQSVGSRLMWLRRFGAVERVPGRNPAEWMLTEPGRSLAFGTARKSQLNAVNDAAPEQLLLIVREIGTLQREVHGETARNLIRREWYRSSRRNGR